MVDQCKIRFNGWRGRVAMVIDQLEAGGAQRQFCLLAHRLNQRGYGIEVFTLRNDPFFQYALAGGAAIPVNAINARNRAVLFRRLRVSLRRYDPAVVISFLSWPNLLVELTGLPKRKYAILVSERNTDVAPPSLRRRLRYFCHRFADHIVSNSYAQARAIAQINPRLSQRTTIITNAVDIEYFKPSTILRVVRPNKLKMLILARLAPQKNLLRMIEAAAILKYRHTHIQLRVEWYGKRPAAQDSSTAAWAKASSLLAAQYLQTAQSLIVKHALQERFRIHDPIADVRSLYAETDVVCLPSLYEGYSNVLAEALACGVPVLASHVGDNSRLVRDGQNGFLFEPSDTNAIVRAILRFAALSSSLRQEFSQAARRTAETLLSVDDYTDAYANLIARSVENIT